MTSRWLPSMSKTTRVRVERLDGRIASGVSLCLNLLWATVRKVRPSESTWATRGVAAWTAALSAAACSCGPSAPPARCACQVGR